MSNTLYVSYGLKAVNYKHSYSSSRMSIEKIDAAERWCYETFGNNTRYWYSRLFNMFYFEKEKDLAFFMLRWA